MKLERVRRGLIRILLEGQEETPPGEKETWNYCIPKPAVKAAARIYFSATPMSGAFPRNVTPSTARPPSAAENPTIFPRSPSATAAPGTMRVWVMRPFIQASDPIEV